MTISPPTRVLHVVHLLPQDTTLEELDRIAALLHAERTTFTYSADAAHAIAHNGLDDSIVVVWGGERWNDDIFAWLHVRGVATQARNMDGSAVPGHVSQPSANRITPEKIQHTIHLLPQDTTQPELKQVTRSLHPNRTAFTHSADVAHALMFAGNPDSNVVVWSGERWPGDIYAWLKARGIVNITSNRFDDLAGSKFIFTHWPTDHVLITQKFNVNAQFYDPPLTGHEGMDIQAPLNSNVYAVASGEVYKVRRAEEEHPYGNAIYIRHGDGYRTAYGHLKEVFVDTANNKSVVGGQLIGKADATGNVRPKGDPAQASHLHLTLYHDGATARIESPQPFDIIDPTPYLQPLLDGWRPPVGEEVRGWLFAAGLELSGLAGRVLVDFGNLRAQPGADQQNLGRVVQGTVVRITGPIVNGYYPVAVAEDVVKREKVNLQIGIHNDDGAEWMRSKGIGGWAVQLVELGAQSQPVDATRFEQAGIKMLVRLNYHYSPKGNIPRDNHPDYEPFITACVQTMLNSKGVWGFIFGNETNNPNEFPDGEPVTPERYARLYNRVWDQVPVNVRMGVQAVDPYFGPGSDSRDYWVRVLNNIRGADFLTVHPKTQNSDPDNVDSEEKFNDDPLRWQYLHLRSYEPLLDAVPDRFRNLPVIASEVNPQRHNDNTTLGWQTDRGAEWVRRAVAHFNAYNERASLRIAGVVFYRFSVDDWTIKDKPAILDAIRAAA
jgi:hypothetical protein